MGRRIVTALLALCMALTVTAVPAAAAGAAAQETYVVTLDPNDGKSKTVDKKLALGKTYGTIFYTPTRAGCVFAGWFDDETGGEKIESNRVFDGTIVKLYAHWVDQYTITFDPNGGTLTGGSTIKTGADFTLLSQPSTPTRAGYAFVGWFRTAEGGEDVEDNRVTASSKFYGNTVVFAHWEKGKYAITFDANEGEFLPGGTAVMTTWTDGALSVQPFTPARAGYVFTGWYTEKSGGVLVTSGTVFTGSAVLYAHWKEEFDDEPDDGEYTVSFDPNGGRLVDEYAAVGYTDGGRLSSLPSVYARDGYTFEGWYSGKEDGLRVTTGTVFHGDVTVYAHWSESAYTISFNPNGGRLSSWTSSLKTGEGHRLKEFPSEPERDGYKFIGWYTAPSGGTVVTFATVFNTSTTVYAHWEPVSYTITFNPNGGTMTGGSTASKTALEPEGRRGTLSEMQPDPRRDGYTFDGWYTAASGGIRVFSARDETENRGPATVFTANATVYAHWHKDDPAGELPAYDITFSSNGGLPSASVVIKTEAGGALPYVPADPVRYGYHFEGWYTAASGGVRVVPGTVFSAKATVYARWAAASYVVTFDPNGGVLPDGKGAAATGADGKILSTPFDPYREGYVFNGWYTSPSGGARVTPDTVFTANTTVYAQWVTRSVAGTGAPYVITFDPNGGALTSGYSPMTTDASGRLSWLPGASNGGDTFSGWYYGEKKVSTDTVFTEDATVRARWSDPNSGPGKTDSGHYSIRTPDFISGGAMEIRPSGDVRAGETVTVNIIVGKGYQLTSFSVTDSRGRAVSASRISDSQYRFTMPSSDVTVTPVFSKSGTQSGQGYGFSDVSPSDFFYIPVQWAIKNGIAFSYGSVNTFAPGVGATRGEVVAFLWRAAGSPEPVSTSNPFKDISANSPYYRAVLWARERGITTGYNSTTVFAPDNVVTRGEAVTFLHRAAGLPYVSGGNQFRDVRSGQYFADAVNWAVSKGITNGYNSPDVFAPDVTVSRGEMVTFLYRAQT